MRLAALIKVQCKSLNCFEYYFVGEDTDVQTDAWAQCCLMSVCPYTTGTIVKCAEFPTQNVTYFIPREVLFFPVL